MGKRGKIMPERMSADERALPTAFIRGIRKGVELRVFVKIIEKLIRVELLKILYFLFHAVYGVRIVDPHLAEPRKGNRLCVPD